MEEESNHNLQNKANDFNSGESEPEDNANIINENFAQEQTLNIYNSLI